jgi:hypothetical protein
VSGFAAPPESARIAVRQATSMAKVDPRTYLSPIRSARRLNKPFERAMTENGIVSHTRGSLIWAMNDAAKSSARRPTTMPYLSFRSHGRASVGTFCDRDFHVYDPTSVLEKHLHEETAGHSRFYASGTGMTAAN